MTSALGGDLSLGTRSALPDALRVLVEEFPRATWQTHENFGQMVQFWLQRHAMFRQLLRILQDDAHAFEARDIGFESYAPRLSHYAGTLLNELHSHHQVEDHHYFPRLIGLDARVERGFELLEADHTEMDALLAEMAEGANAVLKGGAAGAFVARLEGFAKQLDRHLTDEEEIIVPVILKSGFDG